MGNGGKRGRLQVRLARYIAIAVVISLVVSMAGIILYRAQAMRRSLESSARDFSILVSVPLAQNVIMYGDGKTGEALERRVSRFFRLNRDVRSLEVVSSNGARAFFVSRDQIEIGTVEELPTAATDLGLLVDDASTPSTDTERVRDNGEWIYRVVVPGAADEQTYGKTLIATFSYERVNQQLQRGAITLLLALILGMVVTERVAALLSRSITKNLGDLQAGVRRIRAGRLDERVRIRSGDEIEELADAFNDMTENLQKSIDRLHQANRELQALDQVKVDLVANVSHELRTPLTALKGFLELLDDGELGALAPEAKRAVIVCRRNVDRLNLRVEDLVALSQMEKTWPDRVQTEPFDLLPTIKMVAESYEVRLAARNLSLTIKVPEDLPVVEGSVEQIERVIINLLDNAVKFTPDGGSIAIAVEECDHEGREGVLTRVVDSGIGIPQDELIRIFDRFHQVDPSIRRRFGGMGLGLSLVHHIVESHQGLVWVESEAGEGASFFVWLPCLAAADSDDGHDAEGLEF